MTFQEWLADFLNPAHILTEGIYNIFFEIIATWVFVRFAFKNLVKRQVAEELKKRGIED